MTSKELFKQRLEIVDRYQTATTKCDKFEAENALFELHEFDNTHADVEISLEDILEVLEEKLNESLKRMEEKMLSFIGRLQ